jgi:hypothetical protein
VGPDELATFGDPLALFRNVNTPEDYPRGGGPIPPAR